MIVEVLSKSTRLKERNEKFDSYTVLEPVTDYVLIEQDKMRVEHYTRRKREEDWRRRVLRAPEEVLNLVSINVQIPLAKIYKEVVFGRKNVSK